MKYELTLLLNEGNELKNIKDLIASLDGKTVKEEDWGDKTLAYSIKGQPKAHFYNFVIEIDKKKVTELKKKLNFNDKLLRYLLLLG